MNRAVFLDRDGVLNQNLFENGTLVPPRRVADFRLIEGVVEATQALRSAGLKLVVVTNQPDVARGTLAPSALEAIHRSLAEQVPLDAIEFCPHDDQDSCECRKPRPGMILRAARRLNLDLGRSFMVGDRWRDIDAGHAAGCRTILVGYTGREPLHVLPDARHDSLAEAVRTILANGG
jgi:D-glycero-D-manno-heptose 1,7-bisphosphate phosphatase